MKHNIVVILVIISLAVLSYFNYGQTYYWWIVASILFIFSVILFFGTWLIKLNYFISSTTNGNGPGISLTFDDGPNPITTPQILEILDKHNVKATFFLIGKNVESEPQLTQEILDKGHLIGSHSYSHDNKTPLYSTSKLIKDIQKGIDSIEQVTGKKSIYFRPPFGLTNPRYKRALKQTQTKSIAWSLRSLDTMAKSKDALLKSLCSKVSAGDVVLFHDNCNITVEVLPDFLNFCTQKGINIVPLNENLSIDPYEN